ncbi:hypothetical protein Patl1_32537 [Pistacia atlantica]|uniref:Uncharacterized protein n=1 Tax=Pistacia atlantica TaxID=434234 RepID=A0ACC1AQT4_9ROSI|nr:hypothetical protein Patl1_32537 [Pistacia atlantica]
MTYEGKACDSEIRQKKLECYANIESGLWGPKCKSSMIAKENCALRCLSPTCYELIYESDPVRCLKKEKKILLGAKNTNIVCISKFSNILSVSCIYSLLMYAY